jgi:hypothetical protein
LSASCAKGQDELIVIAEKYGGLIWAVDALRAEGNGRLLYVLCEDQSSKPVAT